jgi:hypothetical protein
MIISAQYFSWPAGNDGFAERSQPIRDPYLRGLGRGDAQIYKRKLLGPELSPKQDHGLHLFFLTRASTDDIVGVSLCSSSTTWGSAAASWFSHSKHTPSRKLFAREGTRARPFPKFRMPTRNRNVKGWLLRCGVTLRETAGEVGQRCASTQAAERGRAPKLPRGWQKYDKNRYNMIKFGTVQYDII